MEDLAGRYFNELGETTTPHVLLVRFYKELFGIEVPKNIYGRFGRLVNLYGRKSVFYSILDIYWMENIDHNNIDRLLAYRCKLRLENKNVIQSEDLTPLVEKIQKKLERKTQPKVGKNPFEEEESARPT